MWTVIALVSLSVACAICVLKYRNLCRELRSREIELGRCLEFQKQVSIAAEAELREFIDCIPAGVLLLDASGRIRLINSALQESFDVTGIKIGFTILEAFRDHRLSDMVDLLMVERGRLRLEYEASGLSPRFYEVNGSQIVDGQGNISGYVIVFHDVSRLRQLERMRQEFVANVSHELRTPLSMIKGYVETLLDLDVDDTEVSRKFLHTIDRHADRLTFLINDLLTISKLESGELPLNPTCGYLEPLVEKVFQEYRSRAKERDVHLEHDVSSDFQVYADFARLEQVLCNLVDNALKYAGDKGRVMVSAFVNASNMPEITVRDNGPGIPLELRDRIFERFFRVDKSRSREQGGTGLGLAIVKHVVQSHGGQVWAEGELGSGATFHFTLAPGVHFEKRSELP